MLKTKGYAAATATTPLAPFSFDRRDPLDHDVLIDIKYCGICHSDIHQARDEWGGSLFPMVPGHEIAGVVTAVGRAVTRYKVGDSVGVGCFVDSCRKCAPCRAGLEQFCAEGLTLTYSGVERDGKTPTQGGYSDKIVVNEDYVLRIPGNLPLDAAAPLLCAGITLYSPLMHWHAGPGKKVGIVGLGGLGHMGVKIAHALGAHVTMITTTPGKAEDARKLGADAVLISTDKAAMKVAEKSLDLIMNTVSATHDYNAYNRLLRVDGAHVLLGVPPTDMPAPAVGRMLGNRLTLAGSTIGGIKETQEMLDFCAKHGIVCDIETIRMDQINEAYERMLRSDVKYRFVIDMATLKAA